LDFSILTFLFLSAFHAFLFYYVWTRDFRLGQVLVGGLVLLQLVGSFLISREAIDIIITFGGVVGDFALSGALIILFLFDTGKYSRYQVFLFACGLLNLVHSSHKWFGVFRGTIDLPTGGFITGPNHGDLNKLMNDYGFDPDQIILVVLSVAVLSIGACVIAYGAFFLSSREGEQSQLAV